MITKVHQFIKASRCRGKGHLAPPAEPVRIRSGDLLLIARRNDKTLGWLGVLKKEIESW